MTKMRMMSISAAAIAVVAGLFDPAAEARSTGGYAGLPDNPADFGCFFGDFNGVYNRSCSTARRWDMILPVDTYGWSLPTIGVYAAGSSSNVGCVAQAGAWDGSTQSTSPWINPNQPNIPKQIQPGWVYIPSNGNLEVACFLGQGSALTGVMW